MEKPKELKTAAAKKRSADDVLFPVRKVVLSKNGIGYFERQDEVEGNSSFDLYFKSGDMNDVLKSLTMVDVGPRGGLVSSVSYESTKPFDKQLEDLSISLNEESSRVDLISQVKGTTVEVEVRRGTRTEKVRGVVIGLERQTREHPTRHTAHFLSLLAEGRGVQFYDVRNIVGITFTNELLQKDLQHLLSVLLLAKKKDLKSVTAYTRGSNEPRTIRASYVLEAPVWKSSYRLLLVNKPIEEEKDKGKGSTSEAPKSIFQGWALVDNTQNEDWKNIDLSLVAGAANSFIYDLYNPRYVKRTEIEVVQEETHAPPVLEDTVATRDLSALADAEASVEAKARKPVVRAAAKKEKEKERKMSRGPVMKKKSKAHSRSIQKACEEECEEECEDDSMGYGGEIEVNECLAAPIMEEAVAYSKASAAASVEVTVEGKKMEMADMFQYKITNAVTVNRGQSALVPFLQAEFKGSKVAIFNKNVQSGNPLLAVRLKNTFNMPLEGGPLSIFEDDLYVGEAMLGNLSPNEERFVAYAVELKCDVSDSQDDELRDVYHVEGGTNQWNKGRLTLSRYRVYSTTYVFDNKNDRPIEELFLEHPRRSSGTLIETQPADQTLDHFYRFKLKVPAKGVVKFVVKEQEVADECHYFDNVSRHTVDSWFNNGYVDKTVVDEVYKIDQLREEISQLNDERTLLQSFQSELQQDINRYDDMLGALSNSKASNFAGQQKFRDFFTKEQNATKKEKVGVDEQLQKVRKQIDDTNTKKQGVINGIRFVRDLPNARK